MDIQIIQDSKKGYTAMIKDLSISTQGDTRDELLSNIKEALLCYYQAISKHKEKKSIKSKKLRFYFDMESIINAVEI